MHKKHYAMRSEVSEMFISMPEQDTVICLVYAAESHWPVLMTGACADV